MNTAGLPTKFIDELQVKLLNTGKADVGFEWNYQNIISPFTRIYLIKEGEGFIMPNNVMYKLKPGYLYLIPSYVQCNYNCVEYLSQYYVHFTNQFPAGLNIYDFLSLQFEVKALEFDEYLFKRLLELNAHAALPQSDPSTYEKNTWTSFNSPSVKSHEYLETIGILKQLLSRFLQKSELQVENLQLFSNFRKVFQYINANLHQEIRIEKLAGIACYSYDHFTRIFKKTTGMLPMKYVNLKRIEKAQILLLTTALSQKEICDKTGFNNLPYYYRVFQKITDLTPVQYRKMGGLV